MPFKFLLTAAWVVLAVSSVKADEKQAVSSLHVDVSPARAWQALRHQVADDRKVSWQGDNPRFETTLRFPDNGEVHFAANWDEISGATRLTWFPSSPAIENWMSSLAKRALSEPRDNYLCGGADSRPEDLPEASIAGPLSCDGGAGQLATVLLELEKCGDYESALKVLAACLREQHGGGLIRLAWFFENGLGVPKRPEEMTRYLRQASESTTPGYRDNAKVQYATALYFGVGSPVDRPLALRLFHEAAKTGEIDAIRFLREGSNQSWRRLNGGFYADPDWPRQSEIN